MGGFFCLQARIKPYVCGGSRPPNVVLILKGHDHEITSMTMTTERAFRFFQAAWTKPSNSGIWPE
jgi:hypothetical protein